jgi:drug/metabolite transporter (DMT)-like permease
MTFASTHGQAAPRFYPARAFFSPKVKASICIGLSTILIGSGNVAQVSGLDFIGPFTLVLLRSVLALAVLLPFALLEYKNWDKLTQDMGPCALVAALYFAGSIVAQQVGAMTTTATNIGFLINMSAVFVPLLLWVMIREKPHISVWPCGVLAVIGAYLVTGAGELSASIGDWLCLFAGLLDGVWIIALAVVVPKTRAPATLVATMYAVTTLVAIPFVPFEGTSVQAIVAAGPEILWLGVMTSAFGFLLSTKAQETLSPCVVAIVFCFEAIVSAACGNYFLGETITTAGLFGACMIIVAVAGSVLAPRWNLRPR